MRSGTGSFVIPKGFVITLSWICLGLEVDREAWDVTCVGMRRDFWLGLIGVVVLAGCEKPKVKPVEAPVTGAPAEATPPPVVQEAPKEMPPEPAGPKVDDEVYLVRRFSIPIDGGMRGFREGSKVKVVAISGDKLTVTGNDVQFDVQTADISMEAPVVQSAPPKTDAAKPGSAGAASQAAGPTAAAELAKKKARNAITAEISNLQMALNRSEQAISQMNARMEQLYAKISQTGGSGNSPEARARQTEVQRLNDAVRTQQNESGRLRSAIFAKQRELNKIK